MTTRMPQLPRVRPLFSRQHTNVQAWFRRDRFLFGSAINLNLHFHVIVLEGGLGSWCRPFWRPRGEGHRPQHRRTASFALRHIIFVSFLNILWIEYSYASRNFPHNGLMMRHTYYRPQGQRCARTLPSFCVATGGRRDDRTPLTG